jgi:hypothetical protein
MMQSNGDINASTTNAASITTTNSIASAAARDAEEIVSEDMILASCQQGDMAKLRMWTSLGVSVLFSEAPLMRAAKYGQPDVVRYLVKELSADANQAANIGQTALMFAARHIF